MRPRSQKQGPFIGPMDCVRLELRPLEAVNGGIARATPEAMQRRLADTHIAPLAQRLGVVPPLTASEMRARAQ